MNPGGEPGRLREKSGERSAKKEMAGYDRITPEGTRDMLFEECAVQNKIIARLRDVFERADCSEVRTPGFEFYDVFAYGNKAAYYPQESMYKLTDARGRLVTVRPDNTIPIARMTASKLKGCALPIRLYYAQRVFRRQQELSGKSAEVMQMGVELIGDSGFASDLVVLTLALNALDAATSGNYRIELGHVGVFNLLIDGVDAAQEDKALIHRYISAKNYAALDDVLSRVGGGDAARLLRRLPRLFGNVDALAEASALTAGYDKRLSSMLKSLEMLFAEFENRGLGGRVMIDLGLVNQAEYYSALVFRGYSENTGVPVLSGGRYDGLFSDFGEDLPATGFGLDVDALTASAMYDWNLRGPASSAPPDNRKLRVAVTKGRLERSFIELLERAGYDCTPLKDKGRKLLIALPDADIEFFLAKAPDVITYVEHGVCDVGIVGKDTIAEQGGTYYEIMDLGIGRCKFALATPVGNDVFGGYGTKVIASKYPNVSERYFAGKGMDVEIIKIEGSVELAPLLSLADAIVDIVETGTTLKENGLAVVEDIRDISARFIVNVTSMKLKKNEIDDFAGRLERVVKDEGNEHD
jgi:ATP phosphoribosyltransferase regulatory subunit